MSKQINVGIVQQGPFSGNESMEEIISIITRLLGEAGKKGANIVSLCELSLGKVFFAEMNREFFTKYFMEISDKRLMPIFDIACKHEMVVILPFAEKCGPYYFNSAAVIDADGSFLGTYRKVHIPAILPSDLPGGTGSYEKFYFTPGDLGFPVFKTRYGKIGIQICYDRLFPEGSRALALKGAEMIFMPIAQSAYGGQSRVNTWDLAIRCRALENGVFVLAANRAGNENGRIHIGRSMVVSPIGASILAQGSSSEEEVIVTKIDLEDVNAAQKNYPWWRDRRPDHYKELIKQGVVPEHWEALPIG